LNRHKSIELCELHPIKKQKAAVMTANLSKTAAPNYSDVKM